MDEIQIKYLGEEGALEIVSEILKLKKKLEGIGGGQGGSGAGDFDDTALRNWINETFIKKGTSSERLIQDDSDLRDILDNADLSGTNMASYIPTVRAIRNELAKYVKSEILDDYEKIKDLQEKLANLKSEILGGAGQDYDTLKEIEEWINEHQDLYQALISTIATKATTQYVDDELTKVLDELNKKCNVVVCDNQYEFDQILTKDLNTIYLIKGDQDQWFSKEDGDELYDFYGELRERVAHLERLNGISDYESEANDIEAQNNE